MSNVAYTCPTCGRRHFDRPGRKNIKCRVHNEVAMVQAEELTAPDFLFIDDEGHTISKDKIGAQNTRLPSEGGSSVPETTNVGTDEILLATLRDTYEAVTGEVVDRRWGTGRIQAELADYAAGLRNVHEVPGQSDTLIVEVAGPSDTLIEVDGAVSLDEVSTDTPDEETADDTDEPVLIVPSGKGKVVDPREELA